MVGIAFEETYQPNCPDFIEGPMRNKLLEAGKPVW